MTELYDLFETVVIWAFIAGSVGLVIYLAWRLYRERRRRRRYYRHRQHRMRS